MCLRTVKVANNFFPTGCYARMNIKYGSDLYNLLDSLHVEAIKQLTHSFVINFNREMSYEIMKFTVLQLRTPDYKIPQESTSIPACVNFGFSVFKFKI